MSSDVITKIAIAVRKADSGCFDGVVTSIWDNSSSVNCFKVAAVGVI
jgi:hypothetical protein